MRVFVALVFILGLLVLGLMLIALVCTVARSGHSKSTKSKPRVSGRELIDAANVIQGWLIVKGYIHTESVVESIHEAIDMIRNQDVVASVVLAEARSRTDNDYDPHKRLVELAQAIRENPMLSIDLNDSRQSWGIGVLHTLQRRVCRLRKTSTEDGDRFTPNPNKLVIGHMFPWGESQKRGFDILKAMSNKR